MRGPVGFPSASPGSHRDRGMWGSTGGWLGRAGCSDPAAQPLTCQPLPRQRASGLSAETGSSYLTAFLLFADFSPLLGTRSLMSTGRSRSSSFRHGSSFCDQGADVLAAEGKGCGHQGSSEALFCCLLPRDACISNRKLFLDRFSISDF